MDPIRGTRELTQILCFSFVKLGLETGIMRCRNALHRTAGLLSSILQKVSKRYFGIGTKKYFDERILRRLISYLFTVYLPAMRTVEKLNNKSQKDLLL